MIAGRRRCASPMGRPEATASRRIGDGRGSRYTSPSSSASTPAPSYQRSQGSALSMGRQATDQPQHQNGRVGVHADPRARIPRLHRLLPTARHRRHAGRRATPGRRRPPQQEVATTSVHMPPSVPASPYLHRLVSTDEAIRFPCRRPATAFRLSEWPGSVYKGPVPGKTDGSVPARNLLQPQPSPPRLPPPMSTLTARESPVQISFGTSGRGTGTVS